jgi:hypothetical protein
LNSAHHHETAPTCGPYLSACQFHTHAHGWLASGPRKAAASRSFFFSASGPFLAWFSSSRGSHTVDVWANLVGRVFRCPCPGNRQRPPRMPPPPPRVHGRRPYILVAPSPQERESSAPLPDEERDRGPPLGEHQFWPWPSPSLVSGAFTRFGGGRPRPCHSRLVANSATISRQRSQSPRIRPSSWLAYTGDNEHWYATPLNLVRAALGIG